jgi:hypothetical protein
MLGFLKDRITDHVHGMWNQELYTEFWYGLNLLQYRDGSVVLKQNSAMSVVND